MLMNPTEFESLMNEVNAQMCPTALSLHLTRLEFSPGGVSHANLFHFHIDYFADQPDRSFLIRRAVRGEFDNIPSDLLEVDYPDITAESYPNLKLQKPPSLSPFVKRLWRSVPPLWVIVKKLRKQMYEVSPCYRGPAFFPVSECSFLTIGKFKSDDELLDAFQTMSAREGVDLDAMKTFTQKCYEAACDQIGKPKSTVSINKWKH